MGYGIVSGIRHAAPSPHSQNIVSPPFSPFSLSTSSCHPTSISVWSPMVQWVTNLAACGKLFKTDLFGGSTSDLVKQNFVEWLPRIVNFSLSSFYDFGYFVSFYKGRLWRPRVPLVSTWKAFTSIHCSLVHFFNEQLLGAYGMRGILLGTGECRRIGHGFRSCRVPNVVGQTDQQKSKTVPWYDK